MPRFYLWLFLIWLPTAAQAHMLNMTEMSFDVSHQFETVLELKVDLGQSGLMTAEDYWAATQERDFEQQSRLSSALDALNQGIEVYIDGEQSPMFVRSVDIAAISLDAVQESADPANGYDSFWSTPTAYQPKQPCRDQTRAYIGCALALPGAH